MRLTLAATAGMFAAVLGNTTFVVPAYAANATPTVEAAADPGDDLGQVGPLWAVEEPDMLDLLMSKAAEKQNNGEARKLEEQLRERARAYVHEPPSLNVARASHDSAHAYDPTLVIPYDVRDAQGRVLFPAGTIVNPLHTLSFNETLLFVDATDPDQLTWLKRRLDRDHRLFDKVILTGGSPEDVGRQLGSRPVFFDQNRALITKFEIDAVPAVVEVDPDAPRERLLVREFDPTERSP